MTGKLASGSMCLLALWLGGCARTAVVDSLAGENPACLAADTGRPPVAPELLTIPPPEVSPVATVPIAPRPIRPHMDMAYETRRLPPDAPATQPAMPPGHHRPPDPGHQHGHP